MDPPEPGRTLGTLGSKKTEGVRSSTRGGKNDLSVFGSVLFHRVSRSFESKSVIEGFSLGTVVNNGGMILRPRLGLCRIHLSGLRSVFRIYRILNILDRLHLVVLPLLLPVNISNSTTRFLLRLYSYPSLPK